MKKSIIGVLYAALLCCALTLEIIPGAITISFMVFKGEIHERVNYNYSYFSPELIQHHIYYPITTFAMTVAAIMCCGWSLLRMKGKRNILMRLCLSSNIIALVTSFANLGFNSNIWASAAISACLLIAVVLCIIAAVKI